MADRHESSGLLSLASLRDHEKRQAREQAEAARARAEAEQSARLEAARREQERQSAERAARESAEAAARAAQLRSELAQRAEAERSSSLSRSAEELRLSLKLEREARQTAELGLTAQVLRQRLLTSVALVAGLVIGLAALALYFGALRPAADRALGAVEQALLAEQRAHGAAEANVLRATRRESELSARVDSLEERLREARVAGPSLVLPPGNQPKSTGATGAIKHREPQCLEDGDPLNPCLKH